MLLASACKLFAELLAALDADRVVDESTLLDDVAVAADSDDTDTDCSDALALALALEAAAASEGVVPVVVDVIVSNVVGCVEVREEDLSKLVPSLDSREDCFDDAAAALAAANDDCTGGKDVGIPCIAVAVLRPFTSDSKLFVSTLAV